MIYFPREEPLTEEYLIKKYGSELKLSEVWSKMDKDKSIPLVAEQVERLCEESLLTKSVKQILDKHEKDNDCSDIVIND